MSRLADCERGEKEGKIARKTKGKILSTFAPGESVFLFKVVVTFSTFNLDYRTKWMVSNLKESFYLFFSFSVYLFFARLLLTVLLLFRVFFWRVLVTAAITIIPNLSDQ